MSEKKPIQIPPRGSRGAGGAFTVLMRLGRPFMKREVAKHQRATSPEQGRFMGFPILVLTTIGAKTGQERSHILGGFPDGQDAWLVIASKGGAADHPAWFHNVAKNPDRVWVQVGNRKFKANVESLQGKARSDAYQRVVDVAPQYGEYPKKTDREIPVLRVTPAE
jgi:deazaflavin-dependent oxidoreductase (nitroreductase family)